MTDMAIRVENLSKLYRIGRAQQRHDTLRDAIVDTLQRFTFQRSNSGMYVRLAFAVAAHPSTGSGRRLEPEILLVDESLS